MWRESEWVRAAGEKNEDPAQNFQSSSVGFGLVQQMKIRYVFDRSATAGGWGNDRAVHICVNLVLYTERNGQREGRTTSNKLAYLIP